MSRAVRYVDRATGSVVEEPNFDEAFLRWYYAGASPAWRRFDFFASSAFSRLYGWWYRSPASRRDIPKFMATFGLDAGEFADPVESFASFGAFFERRLRPGARPFASAPDRLPSPADGKVLVVSALESTIRLPIKGAMLSLPELLGSEAMARGYYGGAAAIVRLAPQDYHRFHFPDGGEAAAARLIPGRLHSVNPLALAAVPALLSVNKRAVTSIESDHFGRIAQIEVGAMTVGTIVQTYAPGRVARGQEKGTFRFGGSTIVLLFEPGRLAFDADLTAASAEGLEVALRAGEAMATAGE